MSCRSNIDEIKRNAQPLGAGFYDMSLTSLNVTVQSPRNYQKYWRLVRQ